MKIMRNVHEGQVTVDIVVRTRTVFRTCGVSIDLRERAGTESATADGISLVSGALRKRSGGPVLQPPLQSHHPQNLHPYDGARW